MLTIHDTTVSGDVTYVVEDRSTDLPIAFTATATSGSIFFTGTARIHSVVLTLPAFTTAASGILYLYNQEGRELWKSDSKTKGASYLITVDREVGEYLAPGGEFRLVLNDVAGGSGGTANLTVYLYTERLGR